MSTASWAVGPLGLHLALEDCAIGTGAQLSTFAPIQGGFAQILAANPGMSKMIPGQSPGYQKQIKTRNEMPGA